MRSAAVAAAFWLLITAGRAEVMVSPAAWSGEPPVQALAPLQRLFTLTNKGAEAVTVLNVSAPQGFRVDLPQKLLAPGKAVEMVVTIARPGDVAGHSNKALAADIILRLDSAQDQITIPVSLQVDQPEQERQSMALRMLQGNYMPRDGDQDIKVTIFYDSGCSTCLQFYASYLQLLEKHFARGPVTVELVDTDPTYGTTNFNRLLATKSQYGISNEMGKIFGFVGKHAFAGSDEIENRIYDVILRELQSPSKAPPAPVAGPTAVGPLPGAEPIDLRSESERQYATWKVPAVFVGGFVDGFNPCAFTTAVFLIALLTRLGHDRRGIIAAGLAYTAAVFATYFLLGRAILGSFELFGNKLLTTRLLSYGMAAVSLAFAWLQVRDVLWIRAGIPTRDLTVQTPRTVKEYIHKVLREGLSRPAAAAGAAVAGFLVTLLEAVCTGQIYFPTLVALAKEKADAGRVTMMLLIYCTGFVVPLLAVIGLAVRGVSSAELAAWAKRHLVASKLAVAALLVALAVLLVATAPR